MTEDIITAFVEYEDPYVHPLIIDALQKHLPAGTLELSSSLPYRKTARSLQIRSYESLNFEQALQEPQSLINAYIIRKAFIRKHYLANTVFSWVTKNSNSVLRKHVKPAEDFELDYAEFLDDALVEAFDLRASLATNEELEPEQRGWWILKPSMSDRGQGIRLFSTIDELTNIFEEWEAQNPDDDEDEGENGNEDEEDIEPDQSSVGVTSDQDPPSSDDRDGDHNKTHDDFIVTLHLRHFVAQPYIDPPLLLPQAPFSNRKFHIRTYVVAAGALRVYVYTHMLALFASEPYLPPWELSITGDGDEAGDEDLLQKMRNVHLTNTCVQRNTQASSSAESPSNLANDNVYLLSKLPLTTHTQDSINSQICSVTSELFQAALAHPTNFQPLPQGFEVFGVDFLVDKEENAWLLEVNAFPDFAQTGDELRDVVVKGLWEEVMKVVIGPHFGVTDAIGKDGTEKLVKVLDKDLKRH